MSPFLKQCLVTTSVFLTNMGISGALAYSTVLLPQLRGVMQLTAAQESWLASAPGVTMLPGSLLTVPAMRRGRRATHLFVSLLQLASWLSISFAPTYEVLMFGRVIQGISLGLFQAVNGVIIGEYTSPKYRGAFLATLSLSQAVGVTMAHIVGSLTSWKNTAIAFSLLPIVSSVITLTVPESPSWLAVEGRFEECRKAFRWLRGLEDEAELKKMIEARQHVNNTKALGLLGILRVFSKKEVYISVILGALMYLISMISGALIIASYMNEIIPVIISKDCNLPAWLAFTNCVRLASNSLGLYVIRKLQRRTMLFSSGALCVLAFLIQVGYIRAKINGLLQDVLWLPTVLLTFHIATIGLGAMLVPMVIIGEIYPLQHRSLCGSIANLSLVTSTFLILKTFPGMTASVGLEGSYLVYAGVMTLALVVAWFLLPETKARTLLEIEEEIRGKPIRKLEENVKELRPLRIIEQKD